VAIFEIVSFWDLEDTFSYFSFSQDPGSNLIDKFSELTYFYKLRNLRTLIGIATFPSSNPHNFMLLSNLKSEAIEISAYEAFLESAPQLTLQISIVLATGEIGKQEKSF
jgi:hypothetical protein